MKLKVHFSYSYLGRHNLPVDAEQTLQLLVRDRLVQVLNGERCRRAGYVVAVVTACLGARTSWPGAGTTVVIHIIVIIIIISIIIITIIIINIIIHNVTVLVSAAAVIAAVEARGRTGGGGGGAVAAAVGSGGHGLGRD